ncbi:MAG: luciferase family protein [Halopseudomonas sp.]
MELALGQKGPVAPPPVLDHPYQIAAKTVAGWDDVIAATHWHLFRRGEVDGADFYVNERELGHIHLDGRVHLASNHFLGKALRQNGLAQPFPFAGYEHWVCFEIGSTDEAAHAIWLFRLNYLRLRGMAEQDLLEEIRQAHTSMANQPE